MLKKFIIILLFILSLNIICYSEDFTKETIYFIVIDRFSDGNPNNNPGGSIYSQDKSEWKLYWGGDLQGIIDKLHYIKSLGATAIWITPVVENTEYLYTYGNEKVSSYHGYWGKDFKKINPYFGDMETFRKLIEKSHKLGIKIILDIVLNHTSPLEQGEYGAIYDNGIFKASYNNDPSIWFHNNGTINFTILNPEEWENKNLFNLADLNQDNPCVEKYLKDSFLMWLSSGVDAFRIDTVRHVPVKYVKSFADEMYNKKDLFIFGEWSVGNYNDKKDKEFSLEGITGFEKESNISVIDFNLQKAIIEVLAKNKSFELIPEAMELDKRAKDPYSWVTCVDNHDMPRFISTAIVNGSTENDGKRKFEMAIYLIMTSRGIPCIYYGSEHMIHNETKSTWEAGGDPYNRQMMDNFSTDGIFFENINKLAKLRKENPSIGKGIQKTILVNKDIYIYTRELDNNIVLVAMNKGKDTNVEIKKDLSGKWKNERTIIGPSIQVNNGSVKLNLKEYEVGVWTFYNSSDE